MEYYYTKNQFGTPNCIYFQSNKITGEYVLTEYDETIILEIKKGTFVIDELNNCITIRWVSSSTNTYNCFGGNSKEHIYQTPNEKSFSYKKTDEYVEIDGTKYYNKKVSISSDE